MQTVSKLRVRRFPHRAGVSLRSVSIAVADRPVPLSRVWSGSKIIAEDLTGEDISDVLELHSDASAWWVLPRDHDYGALEVRHIAQALDLDEPAIRDLLAEDRRAKFDTIGQARLVITNAVSIDKDGAQDHGASGVPDRDGSCGDLPGRSQSGFSARPAFATRKR